MTETDTDPFSELLSEALRAGPGTAAWKQALEQLGSGPHARGPHARGPDAGDESKILIRARELLAEGKTFREIRAGAGFTRKVMEGIEREQAAGASQRISTPMLVAAIALLFIVVALVWIGLQIFTKAQQNAMGSGELATVYFPTPMATAKFDGSIPAGWHTVGDLPLEWDAGLAPAAGEATAGGAVVFSSPLPAEKPFAFEAQVHLSHPQDSVIAQVFVSSSGDFSSDRATSSHELVWSLQKRNQQVVLNGQVLLPSEVMARSNSILVRIAMNKDQALVQFNGKTLWAGPNQLDSSQRWVGVRFIRSSPGADAGINVTSLTVLTK